MSQAIVRVSPSVPGARPWKSSEASWRVQSDRRCGSTGAQEAGAAGSARGTIGRAGRQGEREGEQKQLLHGPSHWRFSPPGTRLLDLLVTPSAYPMRRARFRSLLRIAARFLASRR